ncbi:MAG: HAD-IIA family hydrolase [Mycobacteriaceae bacterium]|nr:HAD-IIA family hydrolase [Mycobacteriaceae bacterium]MBV9639904.1 HAD-IIA family hydrolase [Mycobacteriaceae bacterium]
MTSLAEHHDCLLVDLDGTVFRGAEPTVGAVATLAEITTRTLYITNNASRSAVDVAGQLRDLGFSAKPDDVVTSAQTVARVLASRLPARAVVLIVGTEALAAEVSAVGLRPVRTWDDAPVAVVQGHSPHTGWADLAEAALAIRGGALWIAANVDVTLPSERGLLPGNGAMVAALRAATDHEPQVTGKPQPDLMRDALTRGEFRAPLVIGDRLDTDIAGANAAQLPSLLVLTGVSSAQDAVRAQAGQRPTYIGRDLRALRQAPDKLLLTRQPAWRVDVDGPVVTVSAVRPDPDDDGLSVVRAAADAVWNSQLDGRAAVFAAGDDTAADALRRWSLYQPRDRIA